ncbi:MAG TPA: hypothetical protein VFC67_25465 [Prolixibacteraceae bacterium]|nr:hypothetical protein [Prolixibacteraceae bacterium]
MPEGLDEGNDRSEFTVAIEIKLPVSKTLLPGGGFEIDLVYISQEVSRGHSNWW